MAHGHWPEFVGGRDSPDLPGECCPAARAPGWGNLAKRVGTGCRDLAQQRRDRLHGDRRLRKRAHPGRWGRFPVKSSSSASSAATARRDFVRAERGKRQVASKTRIGNRSPRTPEQLGARIRKARMTLGLSLAAVAQQDFSRAFLSQIELGRSRPSTKILQIIAERLKRPVEYFLQDPESSSTLLELRLAEATTRIRRGDGERAKALMTELLARPQIAPEIRARAQLVLAEALLRLRAIPEAIDVLRVAIRASEASGWRALKVELFDRMGTAHYQLRHPHEAGRWWDKAMSAYEDAELADPLLKARILGHRANLHYVAGQPREAIAGYQAAIAAAENVMDMPALGGIYEGLAVSFRGTGDLTRALEYAQRSLRLFDTLQDVRMSAQLRNNMAEILLSQGRASEAEVLFLAGAEQLGHVGDRDHLPHLLAGAAEAALNQGNGARAVTHLTLALTAAQASADPTAKLAAERVGGRVMSAAGEGEAARRHFERALELAASVGSPTDMSRVAFEYGRALESQGEQSQALVRYRQAYEAREAADS
ncbi:MAG: transcriptional regulator [Chloroflexi bacterium]|nr:MAG: transcriptional regulator [Chloroflexota bacterium]